MTTTDERRERATALLIRHSYRDVSKFVDDYYGERVHTREELRRALQQIDVKALEHNSEFAAGMRLARVILEEELCQPDA